MDARPVGCTMGTYVRISVLDNGYTLSYDDPEIKADNRKNDSWIDPERTRVYSTLAALNADLNKLLPLLKPEPIEEESEYESAIAEAFAKD